MKLTQEVERKKWREAKKVGKFFLVRAQDKWDFYNAEMKQITYIGFDEVEIYKAYVKVVKLEDNRKKVGVYDYNANQLIPIEWRDIKFCKKWILCCAAGNMRTILTYELKMVLPLRNWKRIIIDDNGIIASTSTKKECLYDWNGNLILDKKNSITFLTGDLIRAEDLNGKFTLHDKKGKQLLPCEYSLIEIISDYSGYQYIKVHQSMFHHGLYKLNLTPIIPCENNYIYYNDIAYGKILRIKRENEIKKYSLHNGILEKVV